MSVDELRKTYVHVKDWEQIPTGRSHGLVSDVSIDSQDQVYLVMRKDDRVWMYDRDGHFLKSWGSGLGTPHGLTVAPDGSVWVSDMSDHTIRHFTADGEALGTIGVPGVASDTGYDPSVKDNMARYKTVVRAAGPFCRPTKAAVAPNGDLFVSDGYGNARVHRFSPAGDLLLSWGAPGIGPGEFHCPHYIFVSPDERVMVADRENDRVQIFTLDGKFLEMWELHRPSALAMDKDGFTYVTQFGTPRGRPSFTHDARDHDLPARLSVFDPKGRLVAEMGDQGEPSMPGNFFAPHGVALDSRGDLYVSEVTPSYGKPGELMHPIQKFRLT
jgi:streptogramin lyase